ncbi:HAD family hydrolase [Enterococcus sp. LJL98]
MKKYQGVIFDLDGLLFDTERLYYQATQEIANLMGIPYDQSIYHRYIGISDEELWVVYHDLYDEDFGSEKVDQFIVAIFNRSVEMFEAGEADLKEGVLELLTFLNQHQVAKVIASSNQRRLIDILLKKAGIIDEFETIFSFEDVQRAKPDPEIFKKAHRFLALPQKEILILEDSRNGVLAAHGAGIDVVMVPDLVLPTPDLEAKITKVLPSLLEVPHFIIK